MSDDERIRRLSEAVRLIGDNHHNAFSCPYCSPHVNDQEAKWRSAFDAMKSRAESAEATIARLGRVVRAALAYYATMQVGAGHATGCPLIERNETCTCGDAEDAALDASFRALTPEDRRRVGIEG